jgi:hypothetical protein
MLSVYCMKENDCKFLRIAKPLYGIQAVEGFCYSFSQIKSSVSSKF